MNKTFDEINIDGSDLTVVNARFNRSGGYVDYDYILCEDGTKFTGSHLNKAQKDEFYEKVGDELERIFSAEGLCD